MIDNLTAGGRPVTLRGPGSWIGDLHPKRLVFASALLAAAIAPGAFGEVTRGALIDAYIQVSSFVAATLLLFYGLERILKLDIASLMQRGRWMQVPAAALFGAIPGCGGAVFVIAAFSSGHVGMGAVVATLTATMGDAAFLLIAQRPDVAAVVLPLSVFVGVISGYVVDLFHKSNAKAGDVKIGEIAPLIGRLRKRDLMFAAIAVPGLALGILQLAQADFEPFGRLPAIVALSGIALAMLVWSFSPVKATTNSGDAPMTRMTEETSFVTVWVVVAYLTYEYLDIFLGLDLAAAVAAAAPVVPLVAILIGFIPGCGPQVLMTTLYIQGVIPFAALIGNAISNDGDALFPAIALNPRAAILATAYSAVPALIVAYGFYFLAPDFL